MVADAGALAEFNESIVGMRQEMIKVLSDMIPIKAIAPASGGSGEARRADFLEELLKSWGLGVKRYEYKDNTGTARPNLVSTIGEGSRTLWVVVHMDTVSEGDPALWSHDPFKASIVDGLIYGRGTNDNGSALISAIFVLKALAAWRADLGHRYGVAIVADEEMGSEYGIQSLIRDGVFSSNDMFVVPDFNTTEGDKIEIAEKSILWLRVSVTGKQVHASTPDDGVNAFRYASKLVTKIDEVLHLKYADRDARFMPSVSTFEMTKHEKNVDSTNIVPGKDVFYIDCRILPNHSTDDVLDSIKAVAAMEEFKPVGISIEPVQKEDAPRPTGTDTEVFAELAAAIKAQLGIDAKSVGVGGGTCAAYFRKKGWPAVVWGIGDDVAHQPDEYIRADDLVRGAKVLGAMAIG